MRRLGCKLFITSHLCYMSLMSQSVDHTSKNRVLCYKNCNINVVINNSTWRHLANGTLFNYLFQSQLWSIVTSGGSAFHNINITCSVTKTFSGTKCLCYDTITDIMLLLLRNHSDAFRHRKCLIPLALPCDYSWHGTTSGPQRSWAESRRLLLARDYSWPVTPGCRRQMCPKGT